MIGKFAAHGGGSSPNAVIAAAIDG